VLVGEDGSCDSELHDTTGDDDEMNLLGRRAMYVFDKMGRGVRNTKKNTVVPVGR